MTKRFNSVIFVRAMVFFTLLIIISYFYAFALDEGNSLPPVEKAIASLFYVLRFPGFLLLYIFDGLPPIVLIFALLVNSAFYALLAERAIYIIFRKNKAG